MVASQLELPRIPEPADEGEVMREQLDFLIEQGCRHLACYCPECQRYREVRAILLERFGEPSAWRALPRAA